MSARTDLTTYTDVLEREHPDLVVPVMAVDPRDRETWNC
jgi:hypothetical protein